MEKNELIMAAAYSRIRSMYANTADIISDLENIEYDLMMYSNDKESLETVRNILAAIRTAESELVSAKHNIEFLTEL